MKLAHSVHLPHNVASIRTDLPLPVVVTLHYGSILELKPENPRLCWSIQQLAFYDETLFVNSVTAHNLNCSFDVKSSLDNKVNYRKWPKHFPCLEAQPEIFEVLFTLFLAGFFRQESLYLFYQWVISDSDVFNFSFFVVF